ncbi:hypothetical protein PTSG_03735 [Salpingoeca rosetta]|uniref:Bestrophin homolog n=1 Tax=Salpingoeca rosetta (strain ATCC 50818 / BSB-021) TaxID=946362 RepID=F2U6F4_SALR5|nr:uncharacterized protein PTSG_03735 [Salpingoeca rosetta]EGD83095.1 hypothetical protein PTSG_03735 [Salpingoeca rosetta]|eukprot:XP_004995459.1 hypothetical protein PTSG_03735 [Salpingoeca rosetta]
MIIYDNRGFFALLLRVKGTVYSGIFVRCLAAALFGVLAAILQDRGLVGASTSYLTEGNFQMLYTFIGTVLGLMLSFRLSMAYNRWEEANMQMGSFRQCTRNIISSLAAHISASEDDIKDAMSVLREMRHLIVSLCVLIIKDLHDDTNIEDLVSLGYLSPSNVDHISESRVHLFADHISASHVEARPARVRPALLTVLIRQKLKELVKKRYVGSEVFATSEARIDELSRVFSSLLRIAATPMPFIMNHFLKVIMALYVFTVPFGIVAHLKWLTPVALLVISLLFFGADQIAVEIEEPLGQDLNDIDPAFHIVRLDIETAAMVAHIQHMNKIPRRDQDVPTLASNWHHLELDNSVTSGTTPYQHPVRPVISDEQPLLSGR